eukprot:3145152-Pleurochrysis_carterae.AAC.3
MTWTPTHFCRFWLGATATRRHCTWTSCGSRRRCVLTRTPSPQPIVAPCRCSLASHINALSFLSPPHSNCSQLDPNPSSLSHWTSASPSASACCPHARRSVRRSHALRASLPSYARLTFGRVPLRRCL